MAGVQYQLTLQDREANAMLARMERAPDDLFPLMDLIGAQLEQSGRDRIENTNQTPQGAPWKKSARAKKEGTPTLFKSGQLAASQTHIVDRKSVAVGSNKAYARIHHQGGTIKRKARSQDIFKQVNKAGTRFNAKGRFVKRSKSNFAQTVKVGAYEITIPARPWLGVSKIDAEGIERKTVKHLENVAEGRAS